MKRTFLYLLFVLAGLGCSTETAEHITFYEVPLVCGADTSIGCGSRIKPFFIDTEKEKDIKESWTNKKGTVIAIVWNGQENENLVQTLFGKHEIEGRRVADATAVKKLAVTFREKGKWLKGMDVDQLSMIEAGTISHSLTQFALDAKLLTAAECQKIREEIEAYFKKELLKVRTPAELKDPATQEKWMQDGYAIYEKHLGKQRADSVSALYLSTQEGLMQEGSCCSKEEDGSCCETEIQSEITCPKCGHKAMETMPTDVCLLKYTCKKCRADLFPKTGDCCVFCTHGTHKCPSKQE
jgi:hypothetical protein